EAFGAATRDDMLYESVSAGRPYPGMEHWLPLFYDNLETLFDYVRHAALVFDHQAEMVRAEREEIITDYYQARKDAESLKAQGGIYHPLPPHATYVMNGEWEKRLAQHFLIQLSPFADGGESLGFRVAPKYVPAGGQKNIFEFVREQYQFAKQNQKALV